MPPRCLHQSLHSFPRNLSLVNQHNSVLLQSPQLSLFQDRIYSQQELFWHLAEHNAQLHLTNKWRSHRISEVQKNNTIHVVVWQIIQNHDLCYTWFINILHAKGLKVSLGKNNNNNKWLHRAHEEGCAGLVCPCSCPDQVAACPAAKLVFRVPCSG